MRIGEGGLLLPFLRSTLATPCLPLSCSDCSPVELFPGPSLQLRRSVFSSMDSGNISLVVDWFSIPVVSRSGFVRNRLKQTH